VSLHRGAFEETLHPAGPIALAHIDSDWYESVRTCLVRLGPRIGPGGMIVLDDYEDYGGCRQAVDEFLAQAPDFFLARAGGNVILQRSS
jgi:asparagine synthase (glutamine-hydrolysing)